MKLEEIDLNVTNKCNIGCSHCLFEAGPYKRDKLSLKEIENVLKEGKKLGAHEVHITGGEPLTRKDLPEILKISSGLGYFVRLQTNMWQFKPKLIPVLLRTTQEVLTSLDGLEDSHDLIRRRGSFRKVIKGITQLLINNIRVVVITAVQRRNYRDIPALVERISKMGVSAHFLFNVTPLGRATQEDVIPQEEWENLMKRIYQKHSKRNSKIDIICELNYLKGDELLNFRSPECRIYARNHAVVLPNGKVFPCSLFITTNKSLGNVKQQSFKNIWENSPVWEFYDQRINDSSCKNCRFFKLCKGGCLGRRILQHREKLPDKYCPFYRNRIVPRITFKRFQSRDFIHANYLCTIILA